MSDNVQFISGKYSALGKPPDSGSVREHCGHLALQYVVTSTIKDKSVLLHLYIKT